MFGNIHNIMNLCARNRQGFGYGCKKGGCGICRNHSIQSSLANIVTSFLSPKYKRLNLLFRGCYSRGSISHTRLIKNKVKA